MRQLIHSLLLFPLALGAGATNTFEVIPYELPDEIVLHEAMYGNSQTFSEEDIILGWIYHEADKNGVDRQLAYDLAWFESRFNPNAENPNSTATGIYQFIDGTWRDICQPKGYEDVFNYKENISCAMEILGEGGISHWLADEKVKNFLIKRGHI